MSDFTPMVYTPRELAEALGVHMSEVDAWLKFNPHVIRITKNIPRIPVFIFEKLIAHPGRLRQRFPPPPRDRLAALAIRYCQDAYVMGTGTFIYFVTTKDQKFVKIGTALRPSERLGNIQIGCPYELSLHFQFPGDIDLEHRIHRAFESLWVRGEWFRFSAPIKNLIAAITERPWLAESESVVASAAIPGEMPDFRNLAQQFEVSETKDVA